MTEIVFDAFRPAQTPQRSPHSEDLAALKDQAQEFETVFIGEMLRLSGVEKAISASTSFGGNAYSSFLIDHYASELAARGGFGLAEIIYDQLREPT
ncbi:MAG: rod-binding protein [Pseudomonadota bacterium]